MDRFPGNIGANPYDRRKGKLSERGRIGIRAWMSKSPARHYKRNVQIGGTLTSMVVHWPVKIVDFLPPVVPEGV